MSDMLQLVVTLANAIRQDLPIRSHDNLKNVGHSVPDITRSAMPSMDRLWLRDERGRSKRSV